MIWFTSDTHFGHKNIVRGCSDWDDKETACRPFDTVEEHDEYLLAQLNKRVKPDDELRHLGDLGLGFAWKHRFPELRARIACKNVHLLLGNHDHLFEAESEKRPFGPRLFQSVKKLFYGKVGGQTMALCHYAMKTWPWQHHGAWMLHGHSHGNLPDDPGVQMLDVGVDTCLYGHERFTPYSLQELQAIMAQKGCYSPDHHQPEAQHAN